MYGTRYSCQIVVKLEFSWQTFENRQISNFTKIHLVGAELSHADKLTLNYIDIIPAIVSYFFYPIK